MSWGSPRYRYMLCSSPCPPTYLFKQRISTLLRTEEDLACFLSLALLRTHALPIVMYVCYVGLPIATTSRSSYRVFSGSITPTHPTHHHRNIDTDSYMESKLSSTAASSQRVLVVVNRSTQVSFACFEDERVRLDSNKIRITSSCTPYASCQTCIE